MAICTTGGKTSVGERFCMRRIGRLTLHAITSYTLLPSDSFNVRCSYNKHKLYLFKHKHTHTHKNTSDLFSVKSIGNAISCLCWRSFPES